MVVSPRPTANPADYGVGPAVRGEEQGVRILAPEEIRYYFFSRIAGCRPKPEEHQRLVTSLWYVCADEVVGTSLLEVPDAGRASEVVTDTYCRALLWMYRRPDEVPQEVDLRGWLGGIARRLARNPRVALPDHPVPPDAPVTVGGISNRFTTRRQMHAVATVLGQMTAADRDLLLATDGVAWPTGAAGFVTADLAQARRRFRGLVLDTLADPTFVAPSDAAPAADEAQRRRQLYTLLVRQDTYPGHVCLSEPTLLRHVHPAGASYYELKRRDAHLRDCPHCLGQLQMLGNALNAFQPHRKDMLLGLAVRLVQANIIPALGELLERA